tara:strand:- start:323 stop:568 length:246 start_codon:yes stop_codon:yes gene_type:complete
MRPDRVDAIREAAEALAADAAGKDIAAACKSVEQYLICLTWSIFDVLSEVGPDTMVAEVQAGMAEAAEFCKAEYAGSQPSA